MKHIIVSALFLVILFCLSVFIFDPSNLYFEIKWLDIPMHILGGFGVASLAIAIALYGKQKLSLIQVLILYLCVTLTWELYEFIKDVLIHRVSWNGWRDTLWDIINGALGTAIAFFIFKK